MADNAYLAVFAVVVWVFLTFAQTAECEKKVCLGCASEKCATAQSPYTSGMISKARNNQWLGWKRITQNQRIFDGR